MKNEMNADDNPRGVEKIRARRMAKLQTLIAWTGIFCLGAMLSSCAAAKKLDMQVQRHSVSAVRDETRHSDLEEEFLRAVFESISWEEDRQAAVIQADSGLLLRPDGSLEMHQATVVLQRASRQKSASRSDQQQGTAHYAMQQALQQKGTRLNENLREKKKKPPAGMLLIPALLMVFAFLVAIRKVKQ